MDTMQMGPAGGNGGRPFERYDIPDDVRLTAVHIYAEWVINALQFDFVGADGSNSGRTPIGGMGGEHHVFYLDEDEYLTGISGRSGWYVDSVRLHTNKRVSMLYGGGGGDRDYSFQAPTGYEVSGLFGRSAWYIDALGIVVRARAEEEAGDHIHGYDDEYETESWLSLAGEGEPVAARVAVRREIVASPEELDALEDAALAEAIAGMEYDEGTADTAIYTQVIEDEESGRTVAVVMAVAAETGGVEVVGDEPDEVAVMVTDTVDSDDDLDMLEEEAVENAIDSLLDELGGEADEVEVMIYSGVSEDEEAGLLYGAVVAIATKVVEGDERPARAAEPQTAREPRPKDLQLVEGIGPKIAGLLIDHGILDLADLAVAPVERLRDILGAAGKRFRLAEPGTWPEQAKLGAAGAWDALTELQSRLKAGRRDSD